MTTTRESKFDLNSTDFWIRRNEIALDILKSLVSSKDVDSNNRVLVQRSLLLADEFLYQVERNTPSDCLLLP